MKRNAIRTISRLLLSFFLPALVLSWFSVDGRCQDAEKLSPQMRYVESVPEPRFSKGGEATIFRKGIEKIVSIDIEIADTPGKIMQGLMYRRSMGANQGMLFIFSARKPQHFWMKNTYIPLDMIFIDSNLRIVGIERNTSPLSETLIPVHPDTVFTIEVNAGFCRKYGIRNGDFIRLSIR